METSRHKKTVRTILVVGLVFLIVPLVSSPLESFLAVDVKYIDIEGITSNRKIDALNSQLSGMDLNTMTLEEIKAGLEKIDWLQHAKIRKMWPDRMSIFVEEQVPLALWNESSFLNSTGDVFHSEFLNDEDLPRLVGPKGSGRLVMWQFQKLNSVVGVTGKKITSLNLNVRGGWSFVLGDISVTLGNEDVMARMRRFLKVYRTLESGERFADIAGIDTRYPNGVAVDWRRGRCQVGCYAEVNGIERDITL